MNDPFATSNPTTSSPTPNATSSPESASGHTHSDLPDGRMIDLFGQVVAPASPSAPQAKAQASTTSATCGRSGSTSSASAALTRSLVSRLKQRCGTDGSILFKLTWKEKDTPSLRSVSLLRASARRISDNDCGSWPTPATRDFKGESGTGRQERKGHPADTLPNSVTLAGWPTPRAEDAESTGYSAKRLAEGKTPDNLNALCATLATNPQPARITSIGELLTGSTAAMESGGQLNPAHSRWLMGLPPEWDACAPTATRSSRKSRQK